MSRSQENLAVNLVRLREAKQMPDGKPWTQEYLAKTSQVGLETIRRIEQHRGSPTFFTLNALALALGSNILELTKDKTPPAGA